MSISGGHVIETSEVILAMDWRMGKHSPDNRALVGYARGQGFLVGENPGAGMLLITSGTVYLLTGSVKNLKQRLEQTQVRS